MLLVSKPLLAVHPLQKLVRVLCPKSAASKGKPGPALWLNVAQPATAGPDSLVRCVILQAQVSVVPFFRSRRASPGLGQVPRGYRRRYGYRHRHGYRYEHGAGTSAVQRSAVQWTQLRWAPCVHPRPSHFEPPSIRTATVHGLTGLNTSPLPCRQPFSVKLPD